MAYAPTFIYPTDAAALKTVGAPTTVTAGPVFDTLVSEAQNLIKEDLGAREGLTTLITNSMIEQAEAAFASLAPAAEIVTCSMRQLVSNTPCCPSQGGTSQSSCTSTKPSFPAPTSVSPSHLAFSGFRAVAKFV